MSGAAVEISISADDARIAARLRRLQRAVSNLQPALDEIGSRLEASTQRRFETEHDPEGARWPPSERADLESGQTLTDTARLRQSITRHVREDAVAVGTNVQYAAIHQLGGETGPRVIRPKRKKALFWPGAQHPVKEVRHPGSSVPKRAFLGVSNSDRAAILRIVRRHIAEAVT